MNMNRRDFLKQVGVMSLVSSSPLSANAQVEIPYNSAPARMVQTVTTSSHTQINVLRHLADNWRYNIVDQSGRAFAPKSTTTIKRSFSQFGVDKLFIDGLTPNQQYVLQVLRNSDSAVLDQRGFKALDTNQTSLRFATISCLCDSYMDKQGIMWASLLAQKPQVIFLIGDAVYVDKLPSGYKRTFPTDSEQELWVRHVDSFLQFDIYKAKNLTPMISVWDDHDYGKNNSGASYSLKNESREIFNAFLGGVAVAGFKHGPGVSRVFEACGQKIFLMDDRFFRTSKEHWGAEQEAWLLSQLNSNPKPNWILNGNQYFGGYRNKESFEAQHGKNLNSLLQKLKNVSAPVVFGSGDVHFSEMMAIEPALLGYKTYEFTSSSLHSESSKGTDTKNKNPRRMHSTHMNNFLVFDSEARSNGLSVNVASMGANHAVYFQDRVSITK